MQGKQRWRSVLLLSLCSFILLPAAFFVIGPIFAESGSISAQATELSIVQSTSDKGEGGFINFLQRKSWSPYVAGIGIGILSWLTFLLSDKPIGVSSAYVRTAAMIEDSLHNGKEVEERVYYKEHPPEINWEWTFMVGILIGAFLSAVASGDFHLSSVPGMWEGKFGNTPFIRVTVAFVGGTVMAIGARWAGGCTSGHGVSGTLQLVVSSWVAVACFFISGIFTAMILYRVL